MYSNKQYLKALLLYALLMSFIIIIYSVNLFNVGYHNLDIGYNMRGLNAEHNLNLIDIGKDGVIRTFSESYQLGINQIFEAFFLSLTFSMLFGFFLYSILKK